MTTGTTSTKGTRLYFAVSESAIHKVACPGGISGLGGPRDQIDITCLDSEEREYAPGFANPGQVTVPIAMIFASASHQALIALKAQGQDSTISWMIVYPPQAGTPTNVDSTGHLDSPGATTAEFLGYVADLTLEHTINDIVRGTVIIQRSGEIDWTLPAATQP